MDRYAETFARLKKEKRIGVCPFAVLGDPTEEESLERIKMYLKHRPDFLEVGIPFSDPSADGPVIQAADVRALQAGMTPKKALGMIRKIREIDAARQADGEIDETAPRGVAVGILTYANIVLAYGIDAFYRDAKKAGADSVLVADIPLEESAPFVAAARTHDIHHICIVSANTTNERLKKIERIASGFLYVTGTLGVTGARKDLDPGIAPLLKRLKRNTKLPLAVGFGISTKTHIQELQKLGADAAIIGSALVQQAPQHAAEALHALLR